MRSRDVALLVLLLTPTLPAVAQQLFDFAVSGMEYSCGITTPITFELATFFFGEPPSPDMARRDPLVVEDVRMIAQVPGAPAGTALALVPPTTLVRLTPEGARTPFFGGVPGAVGQAIAIEPKGRVFMTVQAGNLSRLVVISPAGVQEAIYPLPQHAAGFALAVAPDGCTVYYTSDAAGVRRFNGCTGVPLPDFLSSSVVRDIEPLPGGEVLVAADGQVRLYTAGGTLVRTIVSLTSLGFSSYTTPDQIAMRNGILWVIASNYCQATVLRLSFDSGAEVLPRITGIGLVLTTGLVVGNASHLNVPTAGAAVLALLAFALAAAGAFVVRLR